MLFESWIRMVISEVMWVILTYSHFIGGYIILERVSFVQNLTTWVKFILAIIYNQLS